MNQDELNKVGELYVKKIQDQFDLKNLNDRGGGRASIMFRTEDQKLIIEGLARVLFLQFGRRAGTMPPVSVLEGWVRRKLNVPEDEVKGVAFAIAKKIQKKGTNILTNKAKGLELEIIIAEMNGELLKMVTIFEARRVTDTLLDAWQK